MSIQDRIQAAWRGALGGKESGGSSTGADLPRGRILLLVAPGSNRDLLRRRLAEQHDVIEARGDEFPPEPFDLAIVDATGFRHWYAQIMDAKMREEPAFLPVILVLSRAELRRRMRSFWDAIDEFAVTPLDPNELDERIAMLLRARRLALAQRSRLAYLVNHDRATGLPNKNLFMDRLTNVIRDASVLDWKVAIAVIHIPLSRILKSLGHRGLERAAIDCSTRLRALLGEDVSLARLTTEEWGFVHHSNDTTNSVLDLCTRVARLGEQPLSIGDELVHIAPRIGISLFPDDASNANSLLDAAISALSEARGNAPVFYSREVQQHALRFIRMEARLHEALEKNQLELWFQPQVDMNTRRVVGVEGLVRWRLPNGELVPPSDFIGVAEATGLIRDIDRWVLRTACERMREWKRDGVGVDRVSVNVSGEDIGAADFTDIVESTLRDNDLPPPALELEITETTLFDIGDENMDKLNRLKDKGVSIAVDDFGTGYSSLSYLHRLPITTLKIDKAFVDNVDTDETNSAIARTIVWLARNFKLETVAEGIETEAQAEKLLTMGVTTGQGYLHARPMPEHQLRNWLAERAAAADAADSEPRRGGGQ